MNHPWVPALLGFVSALILMLVGKWIDASKAERKQDIAHATLLGELRAGFAGLNVRVAALEREVREFRGMPDDSIERIYHHGG